MRRTILLFTALVALVTAAVAVAAQPTPSPVTFKTILTASKGKGTKAKPVPVSVSYDYTASTSDGSREQSLTRLDHAWGGVRSNGKYFPKCTAEQISTAQSDSVCPKGSLVATGTLKAKIGPDNDFSTQGASCEKDVHAYNSGQGKVAIIIVGPGSKCVGVNYSPPYYDYWKTSGGLQGGQLLTGTPPYSTTHPLPGVLASPYTSKVTFKKLTTKVKGVTRGYLESVGCKRTRQVKEVLTTQPDGLKHTTAAKVSC